MAEFLLAEGADPNIPDNLMNTPLHLAALYGHGNIVRLLHQSGANINASNDLGSVLHWALEHFHADIVEYLLLHSVDVNAVDKYGNTPLHMAAKSAKCSLDIVLKLIEKGASLSTANKVS